ncbi:hypothetical protein TTRE_0000897001 [Trichuris trichiura]|uniref:Uncharacterized protein n=1 Tax=Trichuris trichiura TaxID=36087 RepID=A0A077ZJM5_TRITR|nr:hypothetical protein TTRE_0000897001 [Trichuris trichiura]
MASGCLTSDADKVLAEMHKKEPSSERICLLYVRLLVERYLDGYSFVEAESVDLASLLNKLLEKINVDVVTNPDSFLWFQLGSALKEMEDLNFNFALARLTQQFDNFVLRQQSADTIFAHSNAIKENGHNVSSSRQRPSCNAMFCCGLLLLDLKLKMSDHSSAQQLVKPSKY